MLPNGPAVEFVNVALRPEAVSENLVDLLAHSSELDPQPREQSMPCPDEASAKTGAQFLPSRYKPVRQLALSRYKLLSGRYL